MTGPDVRSDTMSGRRMLVRVVVMAALIVGVVFWAIGKNEHAAGQGAARFAAALIDNDRRAAPDGAREYVDGVRAYFGPVTGARVIGTHNERAESGTKSSRTFPVADLMLRSARGPAAIELAFHNGGIGREAVTSIFELDPDDAPGLSARDHEQLASAYAERGGIPANESTFKQLTAQTRQPPAPRPAEASPVRASPSPRSRKAQKELRCVQRARGDVTKLPECARS
jgi:hypothetical protein